MPLLGGLFSKKSKPRTPNGSPQIGDVPSSAYSSAASELDSSISCTSVSPTTEYVTADKLLPSSPNGKRASPSNVYPGVAASSSKLRLPFSRKKSASAISLATQEHMSPPRPSYASRTDTVGSSDTEVSTFDRRNLRPPPSRSAIFAAYGGAQQSTRSLPDERISKPDPPSPPLPPIPQQKRSLFNWYKSHPKSEPKVPTSQQRPETSPTDSSFNLKSFRHVRPGSPTHSNISNTSLTALPPPRPRPRGTSTASDSQQRISVAAFREAQARRSQTGSPSPSFRSQSPHVPPIGGSKSYNGSDNNRSSSNLSPAQYHTLSQPQQNRLNPRRSSVFADDSDTTATSSEEEESDDEVEEGDRHANGRVALGRRRTLTQRSSNKAIAGKARVTRSEMGHGSSWSADTSGNSVSDHAPSMRPSPSAQTSRQRASVSTSASIPNAAAKRASILTTNGEVVNSAISSRHVRDSSVHTISASRTNPVPSESDSDSDSDNAPLATLVPPRRPGSAMSNASGSRSNLSRPQTPVNHGRPAPLIDIKTLTEKKPGTSSTRAMSNDVAFTTGPTLISGGRSSTSPKLRVETKREGPSPPTSFVLPPLELNDHSSRFVSSPTSIFSSGSNTTTTSASKPGTGLSDVIKNDKLFPRRTESKESTSSKHDSINESTSSKPRAGDINPSVQEKRREGLTDRLSKVVQQTVGGSTNPVSKDFPINVSTSPQRQPRRASMDITSSSHLGAPESEGDYFSSGGGGIRLVGGGGNSGFEKGEEKKEEETIAPIVIKQRVPPSSFAVTSRPQHRTPASTDTTRQRSSTLLPSNSPAPFSTNKATVTATSPASSGSGSGSTFNASNPNNNNSSGRSSPLTPPATRQRSSTMMPLMTGSPNTSMFPMPTKPFAKRTESPASSTGDSSSGRAPLTPRDGSEVGSSSATTAGKREGGKKEEWGSGVSGLALNGGKGKGHIKRQSVTFEDQSEVSGKGGKNGKEKSTESPEDEEQRRKERRRSEAKAAIELGNVINGRGPIVDDDEDEDQPINQVYGGRMGVMNPMMGGAGMAMPMGAMPTASPSWNNMAGWQQGQLMPAQFMPPPPPDPTFLAAHQQAMMIAKQAYQMAVAQQAMAAAAEEWERSSNMGGFSGGSVYGGSVYGGGSPSMGMGMGGWGNGMLFPPGPRSMYGGAAQSEYGGGLGGGSGGWGSKSVYGESFGPSTNKESKRVSRGNLLQMKQGYGQRDSTYSMSSTQQQSTSAPRGTSRPRTTSTPASPGRAGGLRKAPPPSSWKAGV